MDVSVLLEPTNDMQRLAEVLDGLGHEGRVHTVRTWGPRRQAELFEAAKGNRLDLDYFVPPSAGNLVEVIHDGKNSMPAFKRVQKRFARLPDGTVVGYNHQFWMPFTGPGYFVCRAGDGEHEGEIGIDYTKLPTEKPASWPEIAAHTFPIGQIVYGGGMVDWMRRISTHVSIGGVWKFGRYINQYFVIARKEPS